MPLWILFFTALTLALHSVPAEAPEPEPSAPVEVVLTEPVFRAVRAEAIAPLGGTSPTRPSATQKNPPPAGKPGQGGGFGFL